jgi:hypothetical protein
MEPLTHAAFIVHWHKREAETIPVQYNPTEFTLDKSAQIAEVAIPGLDSPLLQFIRGQTEKLTLDLFFDTTDCGTGAGATSVTTWTDKIYQLVKIEPTRHAPPICTFVWNDKFPGSSVGGPAGAAPCGPDATGAGLAGAAGAAAGAAGGGALAAAAGAIGGAAAALGAALGNQRRNGFKCIVENVKQKFTLFSHEGVPLRATLTVALREYRTLEEQLQRLNLSSPDRTHSHVVQHGETLSRLAAQYYDRPGQWRAIAQENGIDDPRRLAAGTVLDIPPVR